MHIVLVANTSWNIFNFRKGIVETFIQNHDQVSVISPTDKYTTELIKWGCQHFPIPLSATGSNPLQEMASLLQLYKLIRKLRPDVMLSFTIKPNLYGIICARLFKIPIVCNVSGLGTAFLASGWRTQIAQSLYRMVFHRASFVFFQNQDDRDDFIKLVHLKPDQYAILPGSGINLFEFQPKPKTTGNRFIFLMIARLLKEKGVNEYFEACKNLVGQPAEFRLIGGWDKAHSQSIHPSLYEEITSHPNFVYKEHSDQIRDEIEAADVVVLPSYREGTPRTLLEAAAMSKPLVATDVPGCREVVKDGVNGYLCKPISSESLADALLKMLNLSDEKRQEMGLKSRELVIKKFDEKIVINQYKEVVFKLTHIG